MTDSQTLVQFSFLFTALITVAGWFIVAAQTNRREFRKEVREHIKSVQDRARTVRDGATEYWMAPSAAVAAAAAVTLKADVMSLARQLRTMAAVGFELDSELMAAIRTAATGGEFEKKGRRKSAKDADRLIDVASAVEDLILAVDLAFYSRFPPFKERRLWRLLPFAGLGALAADHSSR